MSLTIEDAKEMEKAKIIIVGAGMGYINLREYLTEEIKSGIIIIAQSNGITMEKVIDMYEKAINRDNHPKPIIIEIVAIKVDESHLYMEKPKNHHKHHNRHFAGHGNKKKHR